MPKEAASEEAVPKTGEEEAEQVGKSGTRNTPDQSDLIKMAKGDKKTGITSADAEAYKQLGRETGCRYAALRRIQAARRVKSLTSTSGP